jgi:hypothetical protein
MGFTVQCLPSSTVAWVAYLFDREGDCTSTPDLESGLHPPTVKAMASSNKDEGKEVVIVAVITPAEGKLGRVWFSFLSSAPPLFFTLSVARGDQC